MASIHPMQWTPAAVAAATGGHLVDRRGRATVFTSVGIDSRRLAPAPCSCRCGRSATATTSSPAALAAGAAGFLFEAGRLARVGHGTAARRRRHRGGRHRRGPARPRPGRPEPAGGAGGRDHRIGRQDVDQGPAGGRSWRRPAGGGQRAVVQQRAGGAAHPRQRPGGHRDRRDRDGRPRRRPHRPALRGGPADHRRRHGRRRGAHRDVRLDRRGGAGPRASWWRPCPASGLAVLNADDPRVAAMAARTDAGVLRYSAEGGPADVVAAGLQIGRRPPGRALCCRRRGDRVR